jgi:hypothetical protein
MLEWIPLSDEKSTDKIERIVLAAIAAKETFDGKPIKMFPKFNNTKLGAAHRYTNKYANEAQEAETLKTTLLQKLLSVNASSSSSSPSLSSSSASSSASAMRKRLELIGDDDDDKVDEKELANIAADREYNWGGQLAQIQKSMRQREKERHENMVRDLERRYAPPKKQKKSQKRKKNDDYDDIPEEEFMRIQRNLDRTKKLNQKHKQKK